MFHRGFVNSRNLLCATAIALTACGGGSGGSAAPPPGASSGPGGLPSIPSMPATSAPFTPSVVEYADPNAGPGAIVTGLDGNLYFTGANVPFYGRISPAGVITDLALPDSGGQNDLIIGPDRAFYYLDETTYIGRIDPAGIVTKVPFDSFANDLTSLAVGADKNVWFSATSGVIGSIIPGGTQISKMYHLPGKGSGGILTLGGDGSLWTVDFMNNSIARITTAGLITEFSIPTPNAGLATITTGPDGSLWFAEANVSRLGHISVTGTILSEVRLPNNNDSAFGLQFGPNGKLYVLVGNPLNGNAIDQVDVVTGAVARFLHGHGEAAGMTVGPDGNIWFAETGGIGKLLIH